MTTLMSSGDRCSACRALIRDDPPVTSFSSHDRSAAASAINPADQAGRAELNTSRYSAEAPSTPLIPCAAAASPAVADLRLAASASGSCHTVSLIKRPAAQSAYSSAA